jgi:hypothetical protein
MTQVMVTTNSPGCTLRGAISAANDNGSAVTDAIVFAGDDTIELDTAQPLPSPTTPVTVNAVAVSGEVVVSGGATYQSACLADAGLHAIDLTDPGAAGTSIRGVVFNDVCGRAIKSALNAPAVRVGPRRGDSSLPVTGSGSGSATSVDVYLADAADADREASAYVASPAVSGGNFTYYPSPEPTASALYTATYTDASTTSSYAARAAVPADIVSPSLIRAVASGQSRVRLDFNEPIAQGSLDPADFALTMSNVPRPVVAAAASGNSVLLDSGQPWKTGEVGFVALAGIGAVTDLAGNEVLGGPSGRVFPGGGDFERPVIRSLQISPGKICKKKRRGCKRTATRMRVSLNEKARIRTTIVRASTSRPRKILSFRDRLEAGVSWVKLKNTMVGRKLPRGRMVVTVVAEDVARNFSDPGETIFEVR